MGGPQLQACLDIIVHMCLNIPLVLEKVEGPTTCLNFLGITLDTNSMEAWLCTWRQGLVYSEQFARQEEWYKTRESLHLGLLQLAAKVVHPSGILYSECTVWLLRYVNWTTTHDLTKSSNKTHTGGIHLHANTCSWNGISFFWVAVEDPSSQFVIQTDASNSWGYGAFSVPIMVKEMVPVVLSCAVWGLSCHVNCLISEWQYRGSGSVKKRIRKGRVCNALVACWLFVAYFDILIATEHIYCWNSQSHGRQVIRSISSQLLYHQSSFRSCQWEAQNRHPQNSGSCSTPLLLRPSNFHT